MLERQLKYATGFAVLGALAIGSPSVVAQEEAAEEVAEEVVIVTAQRIGEDIQDVPIAVSALTEDALVEQQVISISDLQLNAPNTSFTATNFGGSSMTIRGVGRLIIGRSGEAGVSTHVNEIPLRTNLNTYEFFDMERVELLRGPQATLFGRNATGGVVNFITNKPEYSTNNFAIDLERGSYAHTRLKGHANVGLGENFALRFAGYRLVRDGYTENLAAGQRGTNGEMIEGIDDDIDGRDSIALRLTAAFNITDNFDGWVMGSYEEEDSDRARITNQVCVKHDLPTTGCTPNAVGFDSPHLGATTGGIFGALAGAMPLGVDGSNDALFEFPRPSGIGLRSIHTDFEPVFILENKTFSYGFNYAIDDYDIGLVGAFGDSLYVSRQDYIMEVGARFNPTPLNPAGVYPTSNPPLTAGGDWTGGRCQLNNGTAGIHGGCVLEGAATNRMISYDQSSSYSEHHAVELKIRSNYDGRFNFLAGVNDFQSEMHSDYYVLSNSLDLVSLYGSPALGIPPLYPGYFNNTSNPNDRNTRSGTSMFGELYYDYSDTVTMTAGMRLNNDSVDASDTSVLFNALNHHAVILGLHNTLRQATAAQLGIPVEFVPLEAVIGGVVAAGLLHPNYLQNVGIGSPAFWSRTLNLLLGPFASSDPELDLVRYYGATQTQIDQALNTPAYSPERIALSRLVPIVPQFNESRDLTNTPTSFEFEEISYRFGMDYQWRDNTLFYATISHGFKPGGLNSAIPVDFQDRSLTTYDPEGILAFEGGFKTRILDGRMQLNVAGFHYDYNGMQTTRILNNSAINDNIDAFITGVEAEGTYQFNENFGVDFAWGFLNTRVGDSTSLDPTNRAGGQSGWVLLNNIDFGALTATNYLARESQISPQLVGAALQAGAALDIRNGTTAVSVSYPTNEFGASIPAYMSRNFLLSQGVEISDGIPVDLEDNRLPNSPEHTLKLGLNYTTPNAIFDGDITYRLDLYWQSESYAREFNTAGDEIEAWGQINASVIYDSPDTGVTVTVWARNLLDKDNVTGHYLTSDTSGFFRNYFLTEPRIVGASLRYAFQ